VGEREGGGERGRCRGKRERGEIVGGKGRQRWWWRERVRG
jgi:hypothetical protein